MDVFRVLGRCITTARLLALCLATGGIAMTVNILAQLLGTLSPYVGIILAIIIFWSYQSYLNFAFQSIRCICKCFTFKFKMGSESQVLLVEKTCFEPF